MKKLTIICSFFILFLAACANDMASSDFAAKNEAIQEESLAMDVAPPSPMKANQDYAPKTNTPRKVIKTASFRFEVKDMHESSSKIESLVRDFGGDITAMNQSTTNYHINNEITIRVPDESFEKLLHAISPESINTNHKKIYSEDLTEEYVDIGARLKNKREVHGKYVQLLRNKAKTVEEVLKAEEAIRQIQEEIEAREGRMRYINNKTAFSTINLSLYQKVDYVAEATEDPYEVTIADRFKNSFMNGWEMVIGIVLILINFWPIVFILGLIVWRRNAIIRRINNIELAE